MLIAILIMFAVHLVSWVLLFATVLMNDMKTTKLEVVSMYSYVITGVLTLLMCFVLTVTS